VEAGEVRETDERAARNVFATLILGLVDHHAETSLSARKEALHGIKLSLQGGCLLRPPAGATTGRIPDNTPS
jgi:hypothetical protein